MLRFFVAAAACVAMMPAGATTVLYTQDFENPVNFVDDGGDININRTVNDLYGGQPAGFTFSQPFTTETLRVGGSGAFGTGYKDPQSIAGRYVVSMLSDAQNDMLGLTFDVAAFKFLNFELDISSIDLDRFGGPFVPVNGAAPTFRLSLYDNPTGAAGYGTGLNLLDFEDITGVAGPNKFTFDWTHHTVALDATGNTNGKVILSIDLLAGGYAALDNLRIAASDNAGDTGRDLPEPGALAVLGLGLLAWTRRRSAHR